MEKTKNGKSKKNNRLCRARGKLGSSWLIATTVSMDDHHRNEQIFAVFQCFSFRFLILNLLVLIFGQTPHHHYHQFITIFIFNHSFRKQTTHHQCIWWSSSSMQLVEKESSSSMHHHHHHCVWYKRNRHH